METTSLTLLERLKCAQPESPDWERLQEIYLPMLQAQLRRVPSLGDEANDLAQQVLMVVVRKLPDFERQRDGSFRTWLRTITCNRIRTYLRSSKKHPVTGNAESERLLSQLEDPASDFTQQWDADHDRHVLPKLFDIETDKN